MRAGGLIAVAGLGGALSCTLLTPLDDYASPRPDAGVAASLEAGAGDAATDAPPLTLCGGKDCLGGACIADRCGPARLAADAKGARGLTLFGPHVYWVNAAGEVKRVPRKGGDAETIAPAAGTSLVSLSVDDTAIYVTDGGGSAVRRVLFDGTVDDLATGQTSPSGIGVEATYVYYVTNGNLRRVPKDKSGNPTNISGAVEGANLVIAGGRVFWLDEAGTEAVESIPLAGGAVQCHFNNQTKPRGLAVDSTSVFHAIHQPLPGGKIRKKKLTETCATEAVEIATGIASPFELAVDATHVYWTSDVPNGAIAMVPKAGGPVVELATGQDVPWGIVVDPVTGVVLWTSSGPTGGVFALVR